MTAYFTHYACSLSTLLILNYVLSYLYFQFQIEKIFKSWDDIERHWNIVQFACGMLAHAQIIVQHVCEKFTEMWVTRLREMGVHGFDEWCLSPLIEIAHEIQEKCIDPFHNVHFNYITSLPLKMLSKMYVFGQTCSLIPCAVEEVMGSYLNLETCSVIIYSPHLKAKDVLEAISNMKQTLMDLFICNFNVTTDHQLGGGEFTFKLNSNLKSVILRKTTLPPKLQKQLAIQLSSCNELKILEIPGLEFLAQIVTKSLGLFEHLPYLDFWTLSPEARKMWDLGASSTVSEIFESCFTQPELSWFTRGIPIGCINKIMDPRTSTTGTATSRL